MGNDIKPYIVSVAVGAVEGLVEVSAIEEKRSHQASTLLA